MKGKKVRRRSSASPKRILKKLFATSIPIGISGIIISIINILDNSITMHQLQHIGCTEQQANILYGAFNMAFTVFSLPLTIVMAVTTSVFPVLSFAHACKNHSRVEKITMGSLRVIMLASTATSALFLSLSSPIIRIIYFNQPRDAGIAIPLLVLMSPAAVLISISSITGTILQAVDKLLVPARSAIIGGSICLVCNYFLIGNPSVGIYGVPIGLCICYLINTVLNLIEIRKAGIKFNYAKMFLKPFLPAACLGITAWVTYFVTYPKLGLLLSTFIAIAVCLIFYTAVLFISKTVEKEDLLLLPGGRKISKILSKFKIMP
jgi:stage V sporulation protein B